MIPSCYVTLTRYKIILIQIIVVPFILLYLESLHLRTLDRKRLKDEEIKKPTEEKKKNPPPHPLLQLEPSIPPVVKRGGIRKVGGEVSLVTLFFCKISTKIKLSYSPTLLVFLCKCSYGQSKTREMINCY